MNNSPSWIKLSTSWNHDQKIQIIEDTPEVGYVLVVIWFKLLALAGKTNRRGEIWLDDRRPYSFETLAPVLRIDVRLVGLAIATFLKLEMIKLLEHGQIYIVNWRKWQNVDALAKFRMNDAEKERRRREHSRLRSRRYRESKKQLDLSAKEQAVLPMANVAKIALVRPDGQRDTQCDLVSQSAQIDSFTKDTIYDGEGDEKRGTNALVRPSVTQSVTDSVTRRDGKRDAQRDAVEQMTQADSFTREDKNVMERDGSVTASVTQRDACVTRNVTQPHKSNNPTRLSSRARAKKENIEVEYRNREKNSNYNAVCDTSLSVSAKGEKRPTQTDSLPSPCGPPSVPKGGHKTSSKQPQEQLDRLLNPIQQQTIAKLLILNYSPDWICKKCGIDGEAVRLVAEIYAGYIDVERFGREKTWLAALFHRPSEAAWSEQEEQLVKKLLPISPGDRQLIQWAYSLPTGSDGWPHDGSYRRLNTKPKQSLLALLKEFQSECDKWRRARGDIDLPETVDDSELP